MRGSSSALTSSIAVTGRMSAKTSPWARPTASHCDDVGDEHARAHDVLPARAPTCASAASTLRERLLGLHVGVAGAGDGAVLGGRRAAGDPHVRPGAHHAAVADDRLPLDARSVALDRQWRKWRRPVKTIVTPAASAASTTSSSRSEPPGWMIARDAGLDRQLRGRRRTGRRRRRPSRRRCRSSGARLLDREADRVDAAHLARRRCRPSRRRRASTIALERTCWQTARRTAARPTRPRSACAR